MFTYFHCYLPETWEAQVKAGLINERSGVRFSQSADVTEAKKFNALAKKGGALYELLRDTGMPLYVDRLQGGVFFEKYPYDRELLDEYRNLLGGNFYGFQMHEWMSNYKDDIRRIEKCSCSEWSEEGITAALNGAFSYSHVYLESADAEEMAALGRPEDLGSFLKNAEALFRKRQEFAEGGLIPCDSYFLAYPVEMRAGVKRLMPEIGAQTPDTRVQVAFARGMTKAKRTSFGTYYEPWGGEPFSVCCCQKDGENEWNVHGTADFPFEIKGERGGSSRSMQRRMHLYSYMAGAAFMSEEWGMCNTFSDWNEFTLSPYGEIKREFIRFTEKYPDIGQPFAPIAVVLPADVPVLEGVHRTDDSYLSFPVFGSFAEKIRAVRAGIRRLFCESGPMLGTEVRSLLNCTVPDALDIVSEDLLDPSAYDYLVDLTGSASFARTHGNKICAPEDVTRLLDGLLPCTVRGNSMKQFTKTEDGAYYVLLTNNSGVVRSVAHGDEFLPEAAEAQAVTVKDGRQLVALEGAPLTRESRGTYHTELQPGGYFFGKIV